MEITEKNPRPQKATITPEEYDKLDIRICTIMEIERVSKTDKLYKMKIHTGLDERTVVSAIADKFPEEKLLHRNMPFILNLEPRTIKGIESQAMIILVI